MDIDVYKRQVWRCENRLRNGIRYCRHSPTLEEELLHGIILKAINRMADQIHIEVSEVKESFDIRPVSYTHLTYYQADVGRLPDAVIDIWGLNNLEELAGKEGVRSVPNVRYYHKLFSCLLYTSRCV